MLNLLWFLPISCTLYSDCTVLETTGYILFPAIILMALDFTLNLALLYVTKYWRGDYTKMDTELETLELDEIDEETTLKTYEEKINQASSLQIEKLQKMFRYAIFTLECSIVFLLILTWDVWVMYDYVWSDFKAGAIKLCLMTIALLSMAYRYCNLFEVQYKAMLSTIRKYFAYFIILSSVYIFVVMTLSVGMCTCNHNDELPGFMFHRQIWSTSFTRWLASPTCDPGKIPCMTYVTLPEEALDGAFINFHINSKSCQKKGCDPLLYFAEYASDTCFAEPCENKMKSPIWKVATPAKSQFKLPPHEYEQREIYSALITGLKEAKSYVIKISDPNQDKPTLLLYKNFDPNNMKIVVGGDVGSTQSSFQMHDNTVAPAKPDLIVIGGDIAYDDNKPYCYKSWDLFFSRMPITVDDEETGFKRLIPGIYAVGNHDAGINAYGNKKIVHDEYGPVYKHMLPHNTYNGNVPDIRHRYSYYANRIGNALLVLSLDSGYIEPLKGEQTDWIKSELAKRDYKVKIAHYHDSIYPGYEHFEPESQTNIVAPIGKEHWVPLFDQYNMTAVSENHNHFFKRTKKLKNGKEHENGTVYLGEGSWGVKMGEEPNYEHEYTVTAGNYQAVWILKMNNSDTISYEARDEKNTLLDKFESKVV